jgi:cell division protein FtsQ
MPNFQFKNKGSSLGRGGGARKNFSGFSKKVIMFTASAVAVGIVIGGSIFMVYQWLGSVDFFQLTSVKVVGSTRLDKQQLMELAGLSYRSNILAVNTGMIKQKLEGDDWIKLAEIKRNLPSELQLKIKERVAVALLNGGKGLFFLDKKGELFAPATPPEDLDYPLITGLETEVDAGMLGDWSGWLAKKEQLKKALQFVRYARQGSSALPRQNISEIKLIENHEYILFLADSPFPIYIGSEVSKKRYYRLAKVLYWLYKKREFSDVNFIRMDYMNNKVLVGKNNAG